MINNLEDAIQHCLEVADRNERLCKYNDDYNSSQPRWRQCAEEHRWLANRLTELKDRRESMGLVKKWVEDMKKPMADVEYSTQLLYLEEIVLKVKLHDEFGRNN